ncbi:MAG: glycosyl transferase family 39 [Acidobacteria bacterium]|nr:glycosyl transferase family 39 [Acidobacteriota bacterium]
MRKNGAAAAAVALLVVGGAFTALFLQRFYVARILLFEEIATPAAAAIITILAVLAAGFGGITIARRIFGTASGEVSAIDALLIGYPTFGTLIALVSWIGTAPVAAVTMLFAVFGIFALRRGLAFRLSIPSPLLVIPILFAVVEAITPANSPDELAYKLAVPQQYLLYGRMLEFPLMSHSYLVLGTNFTDLAALAIGGPIAAKIARLFLYLATLGVLQRFGRRVAGDAATWITTIVAWCPALMLIAGWAWSEWAGIGLLVLVLDRFERWLDVNDPSDAAIAFAAAGASAATKYTALPFLLAFGLIVLWRMRNGKLLARAAMIVALFGGFFYLRNAVWTGSPFAPLLLPNAPKVVNYRSGGSFSGFADLVKGYDIMDRGIVDESLGIILPLAAVASLALVFRRDRITRDLLVAGGVQMPILLTIAPGSRNMVNGVVPLAIAGAMLMAEVWQRGGKAMRSVLGVGAALALLAQGTLVVNVIDTLDLMPYLSTRERAAGYLARTRHFAKPFGWIAASTPDDARILLLGEQRSLYLPRQAVSAANLDGPRIAAWLARFPTPESLLAELRRQGITHVLVGRENYRVGGPPLGMIEKEIVLQLPPSTDAVVRETLARYATIRFRDDQYVIFELHPR